MIRQGYSWKGKERRALTSAHAHPATAPGFVLQAAAPGQRELGKAGWATGMMGIN